MRTIHDISVPITAGLAVWNGDPATHIEQVASIEAGKPYNLSRLDVSAHVGTHVDAPRHFSPVAGGIGSVPLDALMGTCRVWVPPGSGPITAAMVRDLPLHFDRILIKTGVGRWWEDTPQHLPDSWRALDDEAAQLLARRHVRLVGTDAPSVDQPSAGDFPVHRTLLSNSIVVVESLALSRVDPGIYELICLPLRLPDADGAPARAVLLEER
jgi:arylformamidase